MANCCECGCKFDPEETKYYFDITYPEDIWEEDEYDKLCEDCLDARIEGYAIAGYDAVNMRD